MASEKMYLECVLTEKEIKQAAATLAERTQKRHALEDQKKCVTKDLGAQIEIAEAEGSLAANKVSSGREHRWIECEILLNYGLNLKQWLRLDTGQIVKEIPLPAEERQIALELTRDIDQ